MLVSLTLVGLTLGAAVACALIFIQARSSSQRRSAPKAFGKAGSSSYRELVRSEADFVASVARLDGAIHAAEGTLTYPSSVDRLDSRSQADIAQWTALADSAALDRTKFQLWEKALHASTAGDARRWLEYQASLVADHRPRPTKLERTQNAWRSASPSIRRRDRLGLPGTWVDIVTEPKQSSFEAKSFGSTAC